MIGTYINNQTNIEHECTVCGYVYSPKPDSILKPNTGCPKCAIKRRIDAAGTTRSPRPTDAEKLEAKALRSQGLTYE